jgi:hypothetical protein
MQNQVIVNQVRSKLKRILNKADENRTGYSSKEDFFEACKSIPIEINNNDKMSLKRKFIESGGLLPILGLTK